MNEPEMVFPIAHIHYDDEIDESGKVVVPEEVLEAIKTLIRWTGDDPRREGLIDTPRRVGRALFPPRKPEIPSASIAQQPALSPRPRLGGEG